MRRQQARLLICVLALGAMLAGPTLAGARTDSPDGFGDDPVASRMVEEREGFFERALDLWADLVNLFTMDGAALVPDG